MLVYFAELFRPRWRLITDCSLTAYSLTLASPGQVTKHVAVRFLIQSQLQRHVKGCNEGHGYATNNGEGGSSERLVDESQIGAIGYSTMRSRNLMLRS